MVDVAAAIPMLGARLYQELWVRGHGYIQISKIGALLDRAVFDAAVWRPDRLDFAAPPFIGEGLEHRAPAAVHVPGKPTMYTRGLLADKTPPEWRRDSQELKKAKLALRSEAQKVQAQCIEERVQQARAEGAVIDQRCLRDAFRNACERHILGPDFPLRSAMGEEVTVAELFRDPGHWNGARFADPLDPDHAEVPRTAFADLTAAPPYLYSDAQGGVRYELMREVREIVIEKGEKPRATDEILEVIDAAGDLYMHGGELVCVYDDAIVPVNDVALADYLERRIRFYEIKIGKVRTDLTGSLCRRVLAKARSSGQRTMKGIITAPTLRPDGSVIREPGYDGATKLLLRGEGFVVVPDNPSLQQLRTAYCKLWQPFREFPFVECT